MYPYLIYTSYFKLPTYGLTIAIAYLLALWYTNKKSLLFKMDKNITADFVFYSLICGILGGKILYIITFWDNFGITTLEKLKNIFTFDTFTSGFIFYGGFISGIIGGIIFCKVKKINFFKVADLIAPAIALAHSVGRIGCFMAGCCHGRPTKSWIGITFSNPYCQVNPEYFNVSIHPTQLYESLGNFFIFLLLNYILTKKTKKQDGIIFILYLSLYALLRFIIEFYRGDNRGSFYLGLSQAQFLSALVFITSIIIFLVKKINK